MFNQNYNDKIIRQMKKDFAAMLESEIPGQNWDGYLISCYGNGIDNLLRAADKIRCECYDVNKNGKPVMRTVHEDEPHKGHMLWVPDQNRHYLLCGDPVKQVNCYTTIVSICNKELTVTHKNTPAVDQYGFAAVSKEPDTMDIVRDMPCVVEVGTVLSTLMRNQPGLIVENMVTAKMQYNRHTKTITQGDTFIMDGQTYIVRDVATDGKVGNEDADDYAAVLILTCERVAGGGQKP